MEWFRNSAGLLRRIMPEDLYGIRKRTKKNAAPNSVLRCIELYWVYLLNISSTKNWNQYGAKLGGKLLPAWFKG